jgi:hypothetical protein
LSKIGSPSPAARGAATASTTPPRESPSLRACVDEANHLLGDRGVRAPDDVRLDVGARDLGSVHVGSSVATCLT